MRSVADQRKLLGRTRPCLHLRQRIEQHAAGKQTHLSMVPLAHRVEAMPSGVQFTGPTSPIITKPRDFRASARHWRTHFLLN